jgi:hypothetical protein
MKRIILTIIICIFSLFLISCNKGIEKGYYHKISITSGSNYIYYYVKEYKIENGIIEFNEYCQLNMFGDPGITNKIIKSSNFKIEDIEYLK